MDATRAEHLRQMLNKASTPNDRVELLIDLGIELAQQGDALEARDALHQVRAWLTSRSPSAGSIRVMILDGVIRYFDERNRESLDRLRRAEVLARSMGYVAIEAEVSVWNSHFAFSFGDCQLLAQSISLGMGQFEILPENLRGRLSLVVADAFQYVGDWGLSAKWYAVARAYARLSRSRALVTAIEFNRLAVGISRARLEGMLEAPIESRPERAWLMEIDTVESLHRVLGANALPGLIDLCRARLLAHRGEYKSAVDVLCAVDSRDEALQCGLTPMALKLEIEWLRHQSGLSGGRDSCSDWQAMELCDLDDDDAVACMLMIKDIEPALQHEEWFKARLQSSIGAYKNQISSIRSAVLPAENDYETALRFAGLLR